MYILQVALHMHVWYDVIVMYVLLFRPSWFGFGMRGADLEPSPNLRWVLLYPMQPRARTHATPKAQQQQNFARQRLSRTMHNGTNICIVKRTK